MSHEIDIQNKDSLLLYFMIINEYFLNKGGATYPNLYSLLRYLIQKLNTKEYFLDYDSWKKIWKNEENNFFKYFFDGEQNLNIFKTKREIDLDKDNIFIPFMVLGSDNVTNHALSMFIKHDYEWNNNLDDKIKEFPDKAEMYEKKKRYAIYFFNSGDDAFYQQTLFEGYRCYIKGIYKYKINKNILEIFLSSIYKLSSVSQNSIIEIKDFYNYCINILEK